MRTGTGIIDSVQTNAGAKCHDKFLQVNVRPSLSHSPKRR